MKDLLNQEVDSLTNEEISKIKNKSVVGVIAYTLRTFFLQIISLVAILLLTAFLTPEEFGIFFLVSAVVNLFTFLSDIGLAASLIQKKSKPTDEDLYTTFSIQQLLAILIFTIIFLLTPFWRDQYSLNSAGIMLLYALGFSFILSSLKTIPSIILERKLEFNKLVLPQIVENIFFYSTAVFFAWKGYGVTSYTVAVLLRGVSGLITIYALVPWRPKFRISKKSLKGLLKFGVPFQVNDLLARAKDDLLIVVLKKFITTAELGFLGWAQKWSLFPFRFTVDSVIRVTFPAYSRLQKDKKNLKVAIEKSLFFIALIIFPLLVGMGVMARPLTLVIDKYQKWQPALPALYFFIINVMWSSISTPLTNAINAVGKIKITLKLMVMWTTLTWAFTIPAVIKYGFVGAAFSAALVSCTSVVTIFIVKRIANISVFSNIGKQFLASIIMGAVIYNFRDFVSLSFTRFVLGIVFGAVVYAITVYAIMPRKITSEVKKVLSLRKK
ncbi:oligosaccharide flippase family protein [Patescibacteria group bacterium]